ncbi:MAG: pilus assembly protein [Bauldia sp.]|nr:pilus assembly protein [Bauldia sp.]MCW5717596.1 pilus assembly protein [Bauldia sp.]
MRAIRFPRLLPGRFRTDTRGAAALEFALILPGMLALYIGGIEVSSAVMVDHKVTHATSVLADLVTQADGSISNVEMANILDAVTTVISPYPENEFAIVVSGVRVDDEGVARVVWSDARNATALPVASAVSLPTGLDQPDTFLVVAEVSYDFHAGVGAFIIGTIELSDQFYLRPRYNTQICRPTC